MQSLATFDRIHNAQFDKGAWQRPGAQHGQSKQNTYTGREDEERSRTEDVPIRTLRDYPEATRKMKTEQGRRGATHHAPPHFNRVIITDN